MTIWPEFRTSTEDSRSSEADSESSEPNELSEEAVQAVMGSGTGDAVNFVDHSEQELSGGYESEGNHSPLYEDTEGEHEHVTKNAAFHRGNHGQHVARSAPPIAHVGSTARTSAN